ncbi:MAG: septal ring lytic transglycosylase RlpA family protein [Pseudomonadota bacterium]
MTNFVVRAAGILTLLLIAACSTPGGKRAAVPSPHVKVGEPYQIGGRWYYPAVDKDYDRVGLASWYGPNFHGKLTANGEIFDQNRLTAAHPTLPLPSIVEVTNQRTGKKIRVRVNDRGPFAHDRILDLSMASARKLDTLDQGVAPVRVRYVGDARLSDAITRVGQRERGQSLASKPPSRRSPAPQQVAQTGAASAPEPQMIFASTGAPIASTSMATRTDRGSKLYVQVGAFASSVNANAAASRFSVGTPVSVERGVSAGRTLTFVRLGPYSDTMSAQNGLQTAIETGFVDALIVHEVLN